MVSYIVYKETPNNLKKSGDFILVNSRGDLYQGLRSDLPSTQYYFFGFSGFKLLPQEGIFSINFDIIAQYVLQISLSQPINYLKVRFFGISSNPSSICSHCSKSALAFSSSRNTSCVSSCQSDAWLK